MTVRCSEVSEPRVASPFARTALRFSRETSTAACASWRATASRVRCSAALSPLPLLHSKGRLPSRPRPAVRLVDVSSGSVLGTIDGPPATMLAFSGDGTRLAIESGVGTHRDRRCGDAENRRAAGDTPVSGEHRVEQDRDAARRRRPAMATLASSTSPRARRSARRSRPAATRSMSRSAATDR